MYNCKLAAVQISNCKDKSANNPARRGFITTVDINDGQYSIFPEGIDQDFNLPVCFCRTPDGASAQPWHDLATSKHLPSQLGIIALLS
ncbi:hypothetical protein T11_12380 [Trichinella zimbabwensis]|uniref:Uncharacterized protein n=1 Tax=Trichinella zimbabwensis TaxID=268475 RepID=A0A0V1I8H0_9BILA|nr:hypothetical protein T11_12380 [Trichinella zimbabwensis]